MTDRENLPEHLPLFPLGGAILLPGEILPLNVFEPRYLNMLDDVRQGDGYIGIIQCRTGRDPEKPDLAPIGAAGRLKQWQETEDGRYLITLVGVSRFRVAKEIESGKPYRIAQADYADFADDLLPRQIAGADRDRLLGLLQVWFEAEQLAADWRTLQEAPLPVLVDQLAMSAPFASGDRQALLEARTTAARLDLMQELLAERIAGNAGGSMQ